MLEENKQFHIPLSSQGPKKTLILLLDHRLQRISDTFPSKISIFERTFNIEFSVGELTFSKLITVSISIEKNIACWFQIVQQSLITKAYFLKILLQFQLFQHSLLFIL